MNAFDISYNLIQNKSLLISYAWIIRSTWLLLFAHTWCFCSFIWLVSLRSSYLSQFAQKDWKLAWFYCRTLNKHQSLIIVIAAFSMETNERAQVFAGSLESFITNGRREKGLIKCTNPDCRLPMGNLSTQSSRNNNLPDIVLAKPKKIRTI